MFSIHVRVIPRASKPGIAGTRDGALLVRLQSPPVEGAANSELIEIIARAFGVPKASIGIASGERAKLKRLTIDGIDRTRAETALQSLGVDPGGLSDRAR